MIFLQEQNIDTVGWRWAPRSLLKAEAEPMHTGSRELRWAQTPLGLPTERGLRVQYPGYRINIERYDDVRPRNPWPGFPRISEAYAQFRDAQTGQWYYIADKQYAFMAQSWTDDKQRADYNNLNLFPLHDLADTDYSLIILNTSSKDAIFALPNSGTFKEPLEEGALHVRTERQLLVSPFDVDDGYLSDAIRKLALRLREDKLTDMHLEIFCRLRNESGDSKEVHDKMSEDEEFKASLEALKQKMKDMITEVIAEDKKFVQAVMITFGESFLQNVWVLIRDFFRHGYIGIKLSDDQVWFVD